MDSKWLDWAIELQATAQAGLYYTKDPFDRERFQRIREISAEILSQKSGLDLERVEGLFCNETGYQTPKMDTRAAVFQEEKILLVRERIDGKWSLPGGWMDVNQSIRSNVVKEVREEAGLEVIPKKIIALQDRRKRNPPPVAFGICKVFVLCEAVGGAFLPNTETTEMGYFALDGLPPLSETRNTTQQVEMCFRAAKDENWTVIFD